MYSVPCTLQPVALVGNGSRDLMCFSDAGGTSQVAIDHDEVWQSAEGCREPIRSGPVSPQRRVCSVLSPRKAQERPKMKDDVLPKQD